MRQRRLGQRRDAVTVAKTRDFDDQIIGEVGNRDAIRALAANPLVLSLSKAEALFDEMSVAHSAYLPSRLLERK